MTHPRRRAQGRHLAPNHRRRHEPPTNTNAPTRKQLAYLKVLADRSATTFTYPHSSSEASLEINRLKQLQPLTPEERTFARRAFDGDREQHTYGTAPRPEDVVGYGSTATWR